MLRLTIGHKVGGTEAIHRSDDGFGPIRTAHTTASTGSARDVATTTHNRRILETCIIALAVVPILQAPSGEPTRSKDLTELVLNSNPDEFILLAPPFCDQLSQRTLSVSTPSLEALLQKLDDICMPYAYKHNDETLLLVVRLLDATSSTWLDPSMVSTTVGKAARFYCWQMVKRLRQKGQRSWRVQDAIIRFLDAYLVKDPKQEIWKIPVDDEGVEEDELPATVLPTFGRDRDIRIRFRVAAVSPRLFTAGRIAKRDLLTGVYTEIRSNLSADQNEYVSFILCSSMSLT